VDRHVGPASAPASGFATALVTLAFWDSEHACVPVKTTNAASASGLK
jgi:hypothetical protein